MNGKKTASLADDKRARVPFALVSVVLLTTSIVTAGVLLDRSTPEIDVSPDLVHERTTMAAESVIQNAVSDAIAKAGQEPVTTAHHDSEIGKALSSGASNSDDIFERYVKLQIYVTVNNRLDDIEQSISGQEGDARGEASLQELSDDQETIEDAIDSVKLEIGGEDNDLDRGEYYVEIDGVEHTVSTDGQQIHSQKESYDVTGETAVFEMHSQVMEYQETLDETVEDLLYARIYPLFFAKAMYENVMAPHILQANAFPELIHNQELEVYTNSINYDVQQSTFGTTDQSYPTMMNAGNACLAQMLGGQLATGAALTPVDIPLGLAPFGYPGESICYYIMYSEMEQASTTATTDIPSVSEFAYESDWESQGDLYNHTPGAAEGVQNFEIDPENIDHDDLSDSELAAVSSQINEQGPGSEEKIEIDNFANQVYIEMFDKDEDHFDDFYDINESEVNRSVGEDSDYNDGDTSDEDSNADDATRAQKDDIDQLRQQLIEDVEPVEVSRIQLLSADDVFGDMIYQIEQNSDEYVFTGTSNPDLRNAYLLEVINALESAEEGRKEAAEELDDELGDESLEELLIQGQAAIEGELDNPDRIDEIAEDQRHDSRGQGLDRFDMENINRDAYTWRRVENVEHVDARHSRNGFMPIDDNGVPKNVSENTLYRFYEDELPESTDSIATVRVGHAAADYEDRGGRFSDEFSDDPEDIPSDAFRWNIRAIDPDRQIYRATNERNINESLVPTRINHRTYFQLNEINEEKMNLTEDAQAYTDDNVYTMTILDIPEDSDPPSDVDVDEDIVAPDLQPADREDFEFDIRASPGYLSGLPITRDIEPTVRPPGEGPTNPRNSLFTPYSSKVENHMPNPGIPIILPPKFWFASANYWQTHVKAEYARFELQSSTTHGLEEGTENYVRQDTVVEFDIDGQSVPAGSVEPISIDATNHFPMVAPGMIPSRAAASAIDAALHPVGDPLDDITRGMDQPITTLLGPGSWGTGNSLNMMSTGLPLVPEWTPEKCTSGWPDVGAGVDPVALDRGCADYGPIGSTLASPSIGTGALQASVMIDASQQQGGDEQISRDELGESIEDSDEIESEMAEQPEEFEVSDEERERIENLCTEADVEDGLCSDVGARDRYD